jgi:hypothetical protein
MSNCVCNHGKWLLSYCKECAKEEKRYISGNSEFNYDYPVPSIEGGSTYFPQDKKITEKEYSDLVKFIELLFELKNDPVPIETKLNKIKDKLEKLEKEAKKGQGYE